VGMLVPDKSVGTHFSPQSPTIKEYTPAVLTLTISLKDSGYHVRVLPGVLNFDLDLAIVRVLKDELPQVDIGTSNSPMRVNGQTTSKWRSI
jgi:hypothetical protein